MHECKHEGEIKMIYDTVKSNGSKIDRVLEWKWMLIGGGIASASIVAAVTSVLLEISKITFK